MLKEITHASARRKMKGPSLHLESRGVALKDSTRFCKG